MSKKQVFVTSPDRARLQDCISVWRDFSGSSDRNFVDALDEEIRDATVVYDQKETPPDIVTMRSRVRVRDLDTDEEQEYILVYPSETGTDPLRLSILKPLGIAMLGYRVGDTFECQLNGQRHSYKVLSVVYQPEAAGDYHL